MIHFLYLFDNYFCIRKDLLKVILLYIIKQKNYTVSDGHQKEYDIEDDG